jgi:pimeloyl-ACP methyl ester carboxylesterase
MNARPIVFSCDSLDLEGELHVPDMPRGLVVFPHGSGSCRRSQRNRAIVRVLQQSGFATLPLDLLSAAEDEEYRRRFDIDLLTERLGQAVAHAARLPDLAGLRIGLFGASTGAASALRLAATLPDVIAAVVARGGRPDLAGERALRHVTAPTLLIVGGDDPEGRALNRGARAQLVACERALMVLPGATHFFEEAGALERVAAESARWFERHLAPPAP